jgi:hypothetical protein
VQLNVLAMRRTRQKNGSSKQQQRQVLGAPGYFNPNSHPSAGRAG